MPSRRTLASKSIAKRCCTNDEPDDKEPIEWRLEESHYVSQLSRVPVTDETVILEIMLRLWAPEEKICIHEDGSDSYMIRDSRGFLAFLLDDSLGLSDVWPSTLGVRLCTVKVPCSCVPIVGKIFNDNFGILTSHPSLLDSPLRITLSGLSMYMDSYLSNRSSESLRSQGDRNQNSTISQIGKNGKFPRQGPRQAKKFARTPVYCTQWTPSNPTELAKWHLIRMRLETFEKQLANIFRAASASTCLNFRMFGRRPVVVRRYSGHVTPETAELCRIRANDMCDGVVAASLELIDRSQKKITEPRFCNNTLHGRVACVDSDGSSCVASWSRTHVSNSIQTIRQR
eukprot:GHVH01015576.1.p1 GENE.GHVH01015576.1~~GHVH01015576.1.p1  ORF type:complete len:342 (-),score=31.11 GHVH01015576.1:737-1762(-)